MDDFDNFDEIQDDIQPESFSQTESHDFESTENPSQYDGTNLWLIAALISLTIIHSFSDKWISWVRLFFKNNLNSKVSNNREKHVCKNIFYIAYSRNILQEGFFFSFYRVKFACKKLSSYLGKKFEIKQDLLQLVNVKYVLE